MTLDVESMCARIEAAKQALLASYGRNAATDGLRDVQRELRAHAAAEAEAAPYRMMRAADFTTPITPAEARGLSDAMRAVVGDDAGRAPQAVDGGSGDTETTRDDETSGPAEVVPAEENERLARAECPRCGWRGKRRTWWSRAQEDADGHNARPCSPEPRAHTHDDPDDRDACDAGICRP